MIIYLLKGILEYVAVLMSVVILYASLVFFSAISSTSIDELKIFDKLLIAVITIFYYARLTVNHFIFNATISSLSTF